MTLRDAIAKTHTSYTTLVKITKMSKPALSRLVNFGEYPTRRETAEIQQAFREYFLEKGITDLQFPKPGIRPNYGNAERREKLIGLPLERHEEFQQITKEDIELMQMDRTTLAHFGMRSNPFINDVEGDEDVFQFAGHELVDTAIREAIEQRGFIAVVGCSGSGKTTIWDGVEADYGRRDDTIICRPLVKQKETLTPEHLARCLLRGLLGDDAPIKQNAEDRGRQLSNALRMVRNGAIDKKAVLYLDDAHFCNASVLRQLKTFFEEKVGRYRLMAIVLIGLDELKNKLAAFPEIGNRIRIVEVPPVPVKDYLQFKLKRVGSSLDRVFDESGLEAFLERFKLPRKAAVGRPLVINATLIRAMAKLMATFPAAGERINREIVDQLPSQQVLRKAS